MSSYPQRRRPMYQAAYPQRRPAPVFARPVYQKRRTYQMAKPSIPFTRRIGGNGAYTLENGPWANRGAYLGGAIGGAYAGPLGRTVGSWLGRRLAHYPAKLFGSGSYLQTAPGAKTMAPQTPSFQHGSDGQVYICHREYIGDIISSATAGAFSVQSFDLNPGVASTFPWLSNLSQSTFQQYKFEGLVFEFRSSSGDALNSTNTALGKVIASINYDFSDDSPNSRYEMENMSWSMNCKPSQNAMIPVECKPSISGMNGGLLYVMNAATIPTGTDPKTYFFGKLFIATIGLQGTNVNTGSLYVTYKVKLLKPMMTRPLSQAHTVWQYRSAVDGTNHFGTSQLADVNSCDTIGVTFGTSTMTLAKKRLIVGQRFMLTYQVVGVNTASLAVPTVAISAGAQGVSYFIGSSIGSEIPSISAPRTTAFTDTQILVVITFVIDENDADIVITLSGGTYPGTGCTALVFLTQVNGTLLSRTGTVV